jgi:hypothetical protein
MQWKNRPRLSPANSGGAGSDHPNFEALNAFLDGELPAAEREVVQEHIANCPICQEELRSLQATVSLVHGLAELEPPRSFQLTPAMVSGTSKPVEQSGAIRNVVPLERTEATAGKQEGNGNTGEGGLVTFAPRVRAIATIAAVLVVVIVSAAFLARINRDDAPADQGGEMARPAVRATDDDTGPGSSLSDEDALFAGEAAAPSRQPEPQFRPVFGTPPAETDEAADQATGMVPTPTLVPLPPPPAILSSGMATAMPSSS